MGWDGAAVATARGVLAPLGDLPPRPPLPPPSSLFFFFFRARRAQKRSQYVLRLSQL